MVDEEPLPGERRPWRWACAAAVGMTVLMGGSAIAKDQKGGDEDDKDTSSSGLANLYIDFRTNYAYVPGGSLSTGLGDGSLFATLSQLATLRKLLGRPALPGRPQLSAPTNQGVGVDVPLTVDLGEALSLYGGFTGSASYKSASGWSDLAVTSWFLGFQADVYRQNGGAIPTLTLQSTLTRSVPDSLLATTSFNTVVEAKYALDPDEMRGWLAGVQYTHVEIDSALARVGDTTAGYLGGFYQWDNNWKVSARVGLQSFAGAQLLAVAPIASYTQPLVRLDLDRMDDDDNRLFGVTAQIAWAPKPVYQLTVRTPLYAIKD
ncbi:hypothetical protein [Bradyrhizobium sp. STM 3809]|uniref:hypothetical protein n=1 Tax=Bradyrhizobium sp. STM 3809 TaxID=551936 RepID=UPI00024086BA|nr:hypothetical protein [Bradyrhizobium sp. STM 3809]CCD97871.1 conserved exported hypothetical protein [Bradyrhizobium sp. STM 3809]